MFDRDESRIGREMSLGRNVDDVVQTLKSDYDRAYFLTGNGLGYLFTISLKILIS